MESSSHRIFSVLVSSALYLCLYIVDYEGELDFSSYYHAKVNKLTFPSSFPRNETSAIAEYRELFSIRPDDVFTYLIGAIDVHTNLYRYPEQQLMRIYNSNQTANNAPDDRRRDVLIWFHDGAWIFGGAQYEDEVCYKLAHLAGFVVVSASYRLAPENPYPAPFNDALKVLNWVKNNIEHYGAHPSKIMVGGEGAGANLAAAIVARNLDRDYVHFDDRVSVIGLLLVHPPLAMHTDLAEGGSLVEYSDLNGLMTSTQLDWAKAMYRSAATIQPTEYAFAPLVASPHLLKLFPHTVIVLAKHDILFDEGVKFGNILRARYVPLDMLIFNSTIYGFFGRSKFLQGDVAVARVSKLLRQYSSQYPVEHFEAENDRGGPFHFFRKEN